MSANDAVCRCIFTVILTGLYFACLPWNFSLNISFSRNEFITIIDRFSICRSLIDMESPNRTSREMRWHYSTGPSLHLSGCILLISFTKYASSVQNRLHSTRCFKHSGFLVLLSVINRRSSNLAFRLCLSLEFLMMYFVLKLWLILKVVWIYNKIRRNKNKATIWNTYHALTCWLPLQDRRNKTNWGKTTTVQIEKEPWTSDSNAI